MSDLKRTISCEEANRIDLVDCLSSLGHRPIKISKNDFWYLSPFRNENTPSFKVNRPGNVWYDHGEGIGGSFIDFGLRFYNCQVPELLERLSNLFPFHQPISPALTRHNIQKESPIRIIDDCPVHSLDLFLYLKQRRIDFHIANKYCRQITFIVGNKNYKTLGFLNNVGGYELRSSTYKGTVSPKGITTLKNNASAISVFEGFFDFLSYQTICQNQKLPASDFLILNSTAFFEKSRSAMEDYETVCLFLDHDTTGEKCTRQALEWSKKYKDESGLYAGHKDLNEWVQSIGKAQGKSHRQGLK